VTFGGASPAGGSLVAPSSAMTDVRLPLICSVNSIASYVLCIYPRVLARMASLAEDGETTKQE
jgi:hypothetical protein